MKFKINYYEYIASREWKLKCRAIKERSGGRCERCKVAPHENTHHLTYQRLGNERLEDLQGLCRPCHEFLSAVTDYDPLSALKPATIRIYVSANEWATTSQIEPFLKRFICKYGEPVQFELMFETSNRTAIIRPDPKTRIDLDGLQAALHAEFTLALIIEVIRPIIPTPDRSRIFRRVG